MFLKNIIRKLLVFFHLDLTKNLEYDRLTQVVLKKVLHNGANTIDIGCHKGEILAMIIDRAPNGKHYAFEPIPSLLADLKQKFMSRGVALYPYALAGENGISTFNYVKNAPAYSGIRKRKYAIANPEIKEIHVELKKLDEVIPESIHIDLIKIDVEGAEFGVLQGAKETIKRSRPVIIFECGLGGSDFYGTKPDEIYRFINNELGLKVNTLKTFIKEEPALTPSEFEVCFNKNTEYYFVASPEQVN